MGKLPKDAKVGDVVTITVDNPRIGKRKVTFKKVKASGFGSWKVVKNEKA